MKIQFRKIQTAAAVCLASAFWSQAQDAPMALPAELYLLADHETSLFPQAFAGECNLESGVVRANGHGLEFPERTPSRIKVVAQAAGEGKLDFSFILNCSFDTLQTREVKVLASSRTKNAGGVTAQIIGDSFVQGSFYRAALVDSAFCPGLKLIGLRELKDCNGGFADEGRGGWTLKDYFTISKKADQPYNGFMQPTDGTRYLGATGFWQNVHKVESGGIKDFESRYQCGRFGKAAKRFSTETGLPLSPAKGDLMFDSANGNYTLYNGKKWVSAKTQESDWKFNYPLYLEIWGLEAPDFLFETLGLNDFRNELEADYSEWDAMVLEMRDSYKAANPQGKFAIVIPCSSCGRMTNRRGDFTLRQNAAMHRFRKHLCERFSDSDANGLFLVDMGITIDNENGYRTDGEGLQTGNPHPYPNYPEMGMPLAAFIQYHR